MNILTKGTLGLLSLGLLATGVSYASAATDTATTTPTQIERQKGGCRGGGFAHENHAAEHAAQQEKLATFLGVSVADLESARSNKTTLEEFATSKGKTKEQLDAFFTQQKAEHLATLKTKLDADVASGKITTAQRDDMLARLEFHKDGRGMHGDMFNRK